MYRSPYHAMLSLQRPVIGTGLAHPLSRASQASRMAEQPRRFLTYYQRLPRIPRPKKGAFSHAGARTLMSGRKSMRLPSMGLSRRLFVLANQKIYLKTKSLGRRFFSTEARKRRQERRRFVRWWTLTLLTVVLGGMAAKMSYERHDDEHELLPHQYHIKPQLWHFYAYSTLPLKAISRLWGQINSINLPTWMRAPTFRAYLALFGVNLDEMDQPDLSTYPNLGEFFFRKLKPGVREISPDVLVSPSDGTVLKFGVAENGEIEQVKGMTYSVDALLGVQTKKLAAPRHSPAFHDDVELLRHHEEFAKTHGFGEDDSLALRYQDGGDGTAKGSQQSLANELSVAHNLAPTPLEMVKALGQNQLYFAVIYLAPGDYHRYHLPTNWVTTLRRHFIGELFLVAPFFQKSLQGLFVLNERVALLGYWKYGFFSMIPVGATNVGSIVVNFDKDLKTNERYEHEVYRTSLLESLLDSATEESPLLPGKPPQKPKRYRKNTVYEATYTNASRLLGGYPLSKGQEVGGFKLGSTVVLVFEAPESFRFNIEAGQKIRMGESLGSLA